MKLLVSALEPSSNLHLKEVLRHLENIELMGIFDHTLGTPLYDMSDISIMGIVDAVKKYRWFLTVADEMVALAKDADKILLMDSSGFNLPLAKKLKARYPNKEITYYILPQVWASRKYRVKKLEMYCDKLLAILPFEVDYYAQGKAQYVGHPLLDEMSLPKEHSAEGTIAFMPGSRRGEIDRLLPIFRTLRARLHDKRALLVVPSSFSKKKIDEMYGDISMFDVSRDTHDALGKSEFAFICSGTATLEAALLGTPFTLAFIAKKFDFFVGTKILGIKQVGLANIILTHHNGSTLHRELLQDEVTVENLLQEYNNTDRNTFKNKTGELRTYLKHGSSENVAKMLRD